MRLIIAILLAGFFVSSNGQTEIRTVKIWDSAPHNAFTDLVRHKGYFYCTFREGENHVPARRAQNGKVRILKSRDGRHWESLALLANEQYDLRDPKISVIPGGRLLVIMGGSDYTTGKLGGCLTHVSFGNIKGFFTDPRPVIIDPAVKTDFDWIWRLTWNKGTGYGVVYQPVQNDGEIATQLLSTTDGIHYQLVCRLNLTGKPNEATVRFEGDRMYIVVRREGQDSNGLIGFSDPPYRNFTWTDLGMRLGGPEFAFTGKNNIALGTRLYRSKEEGGVITGIVFMDTSGHVQKILELPSGGDTSYPGMVVRHKKLWMSYYSSHEGKTGVYFAKVRL